MKSIFSRLAEEGLYRRAHDGQDEDRLIKGSWSMGFLSVNKRIATSRLAGTKGSQGVIEMDRDITANRLERHDDIEGKMKNVMTKLGKKKDFVNVSAIECDIATY